MRQPKPLRPLWTTTCYPNEYDYYGQFSRMLKMANKNGEAFCEMDVGKVWGLVEAYKNLEEQFKKLEAERIKSKISLLVS